MALKASSPAMAGRRNDLGQNDLGRYGLRRSDLIVAAHHDTVLDAGNDDGRLGIHLIDNARGAGGRLS